MSLNISYSPTSGKGGVVSKIPVGVGQHNGYANQTKRIQFQTATKRVTKYVSVTQTGRPLFADFNSAEWIDQEGTQIIPSSGGIATFEFTSTNLQSITFKHTDISDAVINAPLRFEITCGSVTKVANINPATLVDTPITVDLKPGNADDAHVCTIKVTVPANTGTTERFLSFAAVPNNVTAQMAIALRLQNVENSISLSVTELTIAANDTTPKTVTVTSTAAWTATEI